MKYPKYLLIILICALIFRLVIVWLPLEKLLSLAIINDDAFYYFKIARNIIDGYGISFDRLSLTNGFHPLWMILIIPLFNFIHNEVMVIHAVLTLSALIDTLSILMIYKISRKLDFSVRTTIIACIFYSFFPTLFLTSGGPLNGLETSLNALLIFVFILFYLSIWKSKELSFRGGIFLGLISGFLFLARTDNAILILISWIFILVKIINTGNKKTFFNFIPAFSLFLILTLPWLLWSYFKFNSFIQVSGKAWAFIVKNHFASQMTGILDYLIKYIKNIGDIFIYVTGLSVNSKLSWEYIAVSLIFATIILFLMINFFRQEKNIEKEKTIEHLKWILPLIIASFIFVLVHTIRAIYLQPWHFYSIVPIFFIFGFILINYIFTILPNFLKLVKSAQFIIFILIGSIILSAYISVIFKKMSSWQSAQIKLYEIVLAANNIIPPNSRVGIWNAGIFGYFFKNGIVVNLDGVVNNNIYPYIKNYNVFAYVKENKINYLVDDLMALDWVSDFWDNKNITIIQSINIIYQSGNMIIGKIL